MINARLLNKTIVLSGTVVFNLEALIPSENNVLGERVRHYDDDIGLME